MPKYVYPAAGEQLIDGTRMPDADWLTDAMRRDIADDVRLLRNAIAASVGGANARSRLTSGRIAQATVYGAGHDRGDSLLVDWFRERADAEPATLLPTFTMGDIALKEVRLVPDASGHQAPRYERMSTERRRAYGIPDNYLTTERLDTLARMAGLPTGYLLLQLRVDRVIVGSEWQAAPIRPWLRERIHTQLRRLGVEPLVPAVVTPTVDPTAVTVTGTADTEPTQLALPLGAPPSGIVCQPSKKARGSVSARPTARQVRATEAVLRLRALHGQVGGSGSVMALGGGRREFQRLVTSPANLRHYLNGTSLPGAATLAKLERFLDQAERVAFPDLAARDTAVSAARATATASNTTTTPAPRVASVAERNAMEPAPHHAQRPGASAVIERLDAVRTIVGGNRGLFALLGGMAAFERLVATSSQLGAYFGSKRSLPKDDTLQRIRVFLDCVEPALASGAPISPRTLRAQIEAATIRNTEPAGRASLQR